MKITIKTKDTDISMPVPLAMADMAIRTVPTRYSARRRKSLAGPYDCLVSREMISLIFSECRYVFRGCKGLEILHIEGHDGTFISITLKLVSLS